MDTLEKLVAAQQEIADLRRQLQDEHARYEAMLNQAQDAEARYVEAQQARERQQWQCPDCGKYNAGIVEQPSEFVWGTGKDATVVKYTAKVRQCPDCNAQYLGMEDEDAKSEAIYRMLCGKLCAANALLWRAQEAIQTEIESRWDVRPGLKQVHAAITAHLPDPEQKAEEWIHHRFSRAHPDELIRPRLVVIGPQEKLESIRLSVDNPELPNQSGVRAWVEDVEGQG